VTERAVTAAETAGRSGGRGEGDNGESGNGRPGEDDPAGHGFLSWASDADPGATIAIVPTRQRDER